MALIECPECERQVSDAATACPQCGHPIASAAGTAADYRKKAIESVVSDYATVGYRVVNRTDFTVQLSRPKRFNFFAALCCLLLAAFGAFVPIFAVLILLGLLGLVIYFLYYLSKRDAVVSLAVDDEGNVGVGLTGDGVKFFRYVCRVCKKRYPYGQLRCPHCGAHRLESGSSASQRPDPAAIPYGSIIVPIMVLVFLCGIIYLVVIATGVRR